MIPEGIGSQLVTYLLLGFAVFFVIFGLMGLIDGLRKSVYRVITFAVYLVIIVAFANVFTKIIFNMNVAQYLAQVNAPDWLTGNTVTELITSALTHAIGEAAVTEDVVNFIIAIASVVTRFIYLFLMVFVVYFVYWLITWIIWLIFFKPKKKKAKEGEEVKPYKKRRLWGALVTGAKGMLIYFVFITILITGPLSIIPDFLTEDTSTNTEELAESGDVDSMMNSPEAKEVIAFINSYKSSVFYKVAGGDNKNSINSLINDFIWRGSYGGYDIKVREELANLAGVADKIYNVYKIFNQATDADSITINDETLESLNDVLVALSDSEFITSVLSVGIQLAVNMDEIKSQLPEDLDLTKLTEITWADDLKALGQVFLDLKDVGDIAPFISGKGNLSDIEGEGIEKVFTTLSSITFITKSMDILVDYALTLDEVKEKVGQLELDLDNIVWENEIKNLGKVASSILDIGISSFDDIDGVGVIDKINLDGTKNLVKNIFASEFIDQVFPGLMKNVVYKEVLDDNTRDLFDFDAVNEAGWENEFITLINVVKEAKGEGTTAMDVMLENGEVNFEIFKNLRTATLLNSTLLKDAVIQTLLNASEGKGFLADMSDSIVIPNSLKQRDAAGWITYRYKCVTAYGTHVIDETISQAEYAALEDANKPNWERYASEGELYNFIDAAKGAISELNIGSISELPDGDSGFIDLFSSISDETINGINNSKILNGMITKILINLSSDSMADVIVIPASALVTEDGIQMLSIENNELGNIIGGIQAFMAIGLDFSELDGFNISDLGKLLDPAAPTEYICITATGSYAVNDKITPEVYKELSKEVQACFTINKYDIFGYQCVTAFGDYELGDEISVETYEGLSAGDKANFEPLYTKLDKILASDILQATLSKMIIELDSGSGDSVLIIPSSVTTIIQKNGGGDQKIILRTELNHLIKAIDSLDLADGSLDLNIGELISKLVSADPEDPTKLVIDTTLLSEIMRCTISDKLLDMSAEENSVLIIPSTVKEAVGDATGITTTELKNLIVSVDDLQFDFDNFSSLSIGSLIETLVSENPHDPTKIVLDSTLDSEIMRCTISNKLLDMSGEENSILVVPSTVKETVGDVNGITKVELKNLVIAVDDLDIDFDNFSSLSIQSLIEKLVAEDPADPTKIVLDKTLSSSIMHCTISTKLLDMSGEENSVLIVPDAVKTSVGTTTAINKVELRDLVIAVDDLGIEFDNFASLSVGTLITTLTSADPTDPTQLVVDKTLASEIMRYTISGRIISMSQEDNSMIVIPSPVIDTTDTHHDALTAFELRSLVVAIDDMGFDFDNFSTIVIGTLIDNLMAVNPDDPTKLVVDRTLLSETMRYTISKRLLEMTASAGSAIVLTDEAKDTTYDTAKTAIKGVELRAMLVATHILEIDFEHMDTLNYIALISNMEHVEDFDNKHQTRLEFTLESLTYQCTMSKAIIDNANLTTPNDVLDGDITEDAIVAVELEALVHGINASGIIHDGAIQSLDSSSLLSDMITERVALSASSILRATITSHIPTSVVNMPADSYDNKTDMGDNAIKVLTATEIQDFLLALKAMHMTQISGTNVGLGNLFNTLESEEIDGTHKDITFVVESRIIWDTISDKLKGFSGLTFEAPAAGFEIEFLDGTRAAYDATIVDRYGRDEVVAILRTFNAIMGVTDGDSFEITTEQLKAIYSTEAKRVSVSTELTNSVVMTYNLANILEEAINDVFPSTPNEYGISSGLILSALANVNIVEWRDYSGADGLNTQVYAETGKTQYRAGDVGAYRDSAELYNLLCSLDQYDEFMNNVTATGKDQGKVLRTAMIALNNSKVTCEILPTYFNVAWGNTLDALRAVGRSVVIESTACDNFATAYNAVFNETYDDDDLYTAEEIAKAALANVNIMRKAQYTPLDELVSLDD